MISTAAMLFAGILCSIAPSAQDAPFQVGYDQTLTVPADGATAAYAIDGSIAEAVIDGDVVRIRGKGAGTTAVVIVTPSSVRTVRVTVAEPRTVLPPGFQRGVGGALAQAGSAELRYVSEPAEVAATIDMRRGDAERTQRFRIVTAKPVHANGEASTAIPFLSYEMTTPRRDITLFDQSVMVSPLTLDGENVRGIHLRQGTWSFHAGVTSIALFQNAFFSTAPEYVAGLTRQFRLTPDQTLAVNGYAFVNPPEERAIATSGPVGSLLHTYRSPVRNLLFRSELAVSAHGVAGATQLSREEPGMHFVGNLRYEPARFPGLAIANLHGVFADADLMRARSERTTISATAILSDYHLPSTHQTNLGASTSVSHKIASNVAAVAGAIYSSFRSDGEGFDLTTFAVPVGVDAAWKRAFAGFRDQPTTDFHGRIANAWNANAGTTFDHVSLSGFYRHDVDLPAVETFFSAVPGLQEALDRSGIFVANPAQLISLLRDVGLLARLGFTTPPDLRFAPSRDDFGGNVDWFGAHQRLTLSVFRSNTQLVNSAYHVNTTSVSYTRSLTTGAEVAGFVTWGGTAGRSDTPIVGLLVRQPVASLSRLLPATRGEISGHVFRDDNAAAAYAATSKGLPGVEVLLDDGRSTRTDSNGYYAFRGVASAIHRVEVKMPTNERFFLTTDSPAYSDVNKIVNFGVSFVRGAVFGTLTNDAGEGIEGVRVDLQGDTTHRSAVTGGDGQFRFNGVPDGIYVLSTAAETYPTGYDLASLPQTRIEVRAAQPASADLVAKALRSLSGTVMALDPQLHRELPVARARVTIPELGLTTETDGAGKYLFRRVPSGAYTIDAMAGDSRQSQRVMIPPEPGTVVAEKLMIGGRPSTQNVQIAQMTSPPRQTPVTVAGSEATDAVTLVRAEDFRDALAAFERTNKAMNARDRYYYAVALYETARYADAKRELSAADAPDTDEARRYAAKIGGAIAWTQ